MSAKDNISKFTRIPQDTFEALQTGAGMLLNRFNIDTGEYADADIVCATTGGITVSCVPQLSDYAADVDNAANNMKEFVHVDGWTNSITTTGLGTSPELIRKALGIADVDGGKVTPRSYVKDTDFQDTWWVGPKANGGLVVAHQLNSLSTGGFVLKTTKNGKGQVSLTLTGHVSSAAQDVMPMEFYSTDPEDAEGGEEIVDPAETTEPANP